MQFHLVVKLGSMRLIELSGDREIMPARVETGSFFSTTDTEKVRQKLLELGYLQMAYEKPFTQTVYFENHQGELQAEVT